MSTLRKSINSEMRSAGFVVGIPYYVFTKQIGGYTYLVVEGAKIKGYAEIRYTFYKATYETRNNGKPSRIKVYRKNESAVNILRYLHSFMTLFEESSAKVKDRGRYRETNL
ncbi:hypothetical protein [Listeria seeligeri]|uniref:hypothetical protein n=2 Tax=Listeria seeligeri TaxID=1640 RepID=UPI0016245155|nr:hypothetical protein [Listeria seeligeri]EIF6131965.1 hypothetical protein [Listeria monocytogenes]